MTSSMNQTLSYQSEGVNLKDFFLAPEHHEANLPTPKAKDTTISTFEEELEDTHFNVSESEHPHPQTEEEAIEALLAEAGNSIFKVRKVTSFPKDGIMLKLQRARKNHGDSKEHSLNDLAKRILALFGGLENTTLHLEQVTQQLDVERRRIYDIVNILDSLGVVQRRGKNNYLWRGLSRVRETLTYIWAQPMEELLRRRSAAVKKDKSMGNLTICFLKLFHEWKEVIALEEAAMRLAKITHEEDKIRTKIRRLYDIANVLRSLGLIEKVFLGAKKPAFKFAGQESLDQLFAEYKSEVKEKEKTRPRSASSSSSSSSSSTKSNLPDCLAPKTPMKKQETREMTPAQRDFSIMSADSAFKKHQSHAASDGSYELLRALLESVCFASSSQMPFAPSLIGKRMAMTPIPFGIRNI